MANLPKLYVEGVDDIGVINALLFRHGVDTEAGRKFLNISSLGNDAEVIDAIPAAIKANTELPVGFVVDIDVETASRWDAVCGKLREIGIEPPTACPLDGYISKLPDYQSSFGVWLMPDCTSDFCKIEHLVESLVPQDDVLWSVAQRSTALAAETADASQAPRFREVDRIKAEVHCWLAWSPRPGAPLGAAINGKILGCDSPQALAFLGWLRRLYNFATNVP